MSSVTSLYSPVSTALSAAARATLRRPIEVGVGGPVDAAGALERADTVELSAVASSAAGVAAARPLAVPYGRIPEQGFDEAKVARIREQLKDGTYLSPEKFDAALAKLRADLDLLP